MNCMIYLWRFNKKFFEIEAFTFVTADEDLPRKIRLVLPSPNAKYIKRASYFEDCNLTHKGYPIFKEVQPPHEGSSQP